MKQEVTNFSRFYAIFKRIPYSGDREDLRKEMVSRVTLGRTDSLRELTKREYQDLCDSLDKIYPDTSQWSAAREELRRQRSICLVLMQKLRIDTTDWNRINAFCLDGRIAGKVFRDLSTDELRDLSFKLRSIYRKGGLREIEEPAGQVATIVQLK